MSERGSIFLHRLDYLLGVPLVHLTALLRKKDAYRTLVQMRAHPEKIRRIAFLCLGAIGDALLLTALITALREKLPRAECILITSQANAQVAPLVPGLTSWATFSLSEIPKLISFLRNQKIDILFDSTQWARLGAIISNSSKARISIGFETKGQRRACGYTASVAHSSNVHEYENFLALGRALFPDLTGKPKIEIPAIRSDLVDEVLRKASQKLIFLHMYPSGIHAERRAWPAAYWAHLAKKLIDSGYTVCFTGAKKDRKAMEAFTAQFHLPASISLVGRATLLELARLFRTAKAVVSVNTGIMHLAAIAGAPTIALNGPTNPKRWGPVGKKTISLLPVGESCGYLDLGFEYKEPFIPCMQLLGVEDVQRALKKMGVIEQIDGS